VAEWCWDWYGNYTSDPQINPTGIAGNPFSVPYGGGPSTTGAVVRGGGYDDDAKYTVARSYANWITARPSVGFRVVRP